MLNVSSNQNEGNLPKSDSLDLKYSKSVLKYLLNKDSVKKSSLFSIVSNNLVLDKLLDKLWLDGYIDINKNKIGPIIYRISLTNKGRFVAGVLIKLEALISDFDDKKSRTFILDYNSIQYL